MRIRALAIVVAVVLAIGAGSIAAVLLQPLPSVDTTELNDLQARAAKAWPEIDAAAFPATAPPLTVLDASGAILYSDAPELRSELAAARDNAHVLSLSNDGDFVGLLLVENTREAGLEAQRHTALLITIVVFAAVALVLGGALLQLWALVIRPFRRLQGFARELARGNLDSPLPMDRGNTFGAFSESFDLMRTELRRARESERTAREENRETLAQIGHDIRTPVAIIAAAGDVLGLNETDPEKLARLGTISSRTKQLSRLLDDLVTTNANDLVALSVDTAPAASTDLAELIRGCDPEQAILPFTLPECIVEYDPERMRQVIDNLLSNSRKFAGAPVTVAGAIVQAGVCAAAQAEPGSAQRAGQPRALRLEFSDAGPGVSEHDLTVILAQGVRGSNAAGVPGSGLGLFIAARLMEQMGGEVNISSLGVRSVLPGHSGFDRGDPASRKLPQDDKGGNSSGFTVTLLLPLSGD